MPVCGNYLFFELPKKIVLNPKDGKLDTCVTGTLARILSPFWFIFLSKKEKIDVDFMYSM